ncbi:MAG TPA: NmrA family NAD(P)-binding protein [Anaeromyxobacter sp.]|nr:NmrA family NAD(P)-binding protein [Anaeromyxobacter sp.]
MERGSIVVFGATGHVGGVIADRLLAAGRKVRAVSRSSGRLEALARRGAEALTGDMADAAFLKRALSGAEAAFVLIPPPSAPTGIRAAQDRLSVALADGLRAAGVSYAVSLSSIGADQRSGGGPIDGLHVLEERLNGVPGLNVLHLRAGYFFENHLASIAMIRTMGILGSALRADLRMAQIATRDIGEVAARRLEALDLAGREILELQGQRDLTPAECAGILGKAIGKPDLTYAAFPYPDAEKGMVKAGVPAEMAALYVEMSRGFNEGTLKPLAPRSAKTTTRTSLETWAAEVFAPAFRG